MFVLPLLVGLIGSQDLGITTSSAAQSISKYLYASQTQSYTTVRNNAVIFFKKLPSSTVTVYTRNTASSNSYKKVDSFDSDSTSNRAFYFDGKYAKIEIKPKVSGYVEFIWLYTPSYYSCDEMMIVTKNGYQINSPNTTSTLSSGKYYCVALMADYGHQAYISYVSSTSKGRLYSVNEESMSSSLSAPTTRTFTNPSLLMYRPSSSSKFYKGSAFQATLMYTSYADYDYHIVGKFKNGANGYSSLDANGVSRTGTSGSGLSAGGIVGTVMGAFFAIAIVAVVAACFCRKKNRKNKSHSSSSSSSSKKNMYPQQPMAAYPPQGQMYPPQPQFMPQPPPYQQPGQVYAPPPQVVTNPYNQPAGYYPPPPPPPSQGQNFYQ